MKKSPFDMAAEALDDNDSTFSSTDIQKANAITEGIKALQYPIDFFSISEFTSQQIVLITKARIVGEWWKIGEYTKICEMLAVMQLSRNRKSRDEIVKVLIGMQKKNAVQKGIDKLKGEGD